MAASHSRTAFRSKRRGISAAGSAAAWPSARTPPAASASARPLGVSGLRMSLRSAAGRAQDDVGAFGASGISAHARAEAVLIGADASQRDDGAGLAARVVERVVGVPVEDGVQHVHGLRVARAHGQHGGLDPDGRDFLLDEVAAVERIAVNDFAPREQEVLDGVGRNAVRLDRRARMPLRQAHDAPLPDRRDDPVTLRGQRRRQFSQLVCAK